MKSHYCSQCGAALTANAKFCEQCGAAVPQSAADVPGQMSEAVAMPSVADVPQQPADELEWQSEMKLINNRFFLGDLVKWTLVTMLVCAAIFIPLLGISGGKDGLFAALLFLALPVVLIFLGTFIFVIIMGNRLPLAFRVDALGVNMRSVSKRVTHINRTAMVLGVLAGKPGMVGAGAIGASQENTTIPWQDLRKVCFHPVQQVIFLKGGIFSRIRVYCTPQNYPSVERLIRSRMPANVNATVR
jgi:hypothetical protein